MYIYIYIYKSTLAYFFICMYLFLCKSVCLCTHACLSIFISIKVQVKRIEYFIMKL